jgi:hypothetical protein
VEREHVAVVVLLLVLVVALVPVVLGQTRDESVDLPQSDGAGPSAGRLVRDDELSGSCLELSPPRRTEGSCVVTIAPTDVPALDVPLIGRFVPREVRRIDLQLADEGCTADVELAFDDVEVEAELGPDEDDDERMEASLPVGAAGARLDVDGGLSCVVLLGDAGA